MSCEFNGDLNSFRELEGFVNFFESKYPDCNDFKKLLKITRPDKVDNKYDCVNKAVAGYLTFLKGTGDTNSSFVHFRELSKNAFSKPMNIDTGIFTNPIKTASYIKFCTVNDIKNAFGLDYNNVGKGKTDLFPTYQQFLVEYPFLDEFEGPIKYRLHLYYLLHGYMRQYCIYDYLLCYSFHLNEYYTNVNYLKGSKSRSKKSKSKKSKSKSKTMSKRGSKRLTGGSGPGQGPGQGQLQKKSGLTHTDRDAVSRRLPFYIYIVNEPVYSSLSLTSLTVAGSTLFGAVASLSSPFFGEVVSAAGSVKKAAEMLEKEMPSQKDLFNLSKRGVLASYAKIGLAIGGLVSTFFIAAGASGVFEDPRIVATPRISSGFFSGLFNFLRWRPSRLRQVKTRDIKFTNTENGTGGKKNMTNKAAAGIYTQSRVDKLRAQLGKFHLFIINDQFITDKSVQQFRLIFKEYVWSSMCLQFDQRVEDLVFLKQQEKILLKRHEMASVSFEHIAVARNLRPGEPVRPDEPGLELVRQNSRECGVDPVINGAVAKLTPEEQFAINERTAKAMGVATPEKWKQMDQEALLAAQRGAIENLRLTPEEIEEIYHVCRRDVAGLIIESGHNYLNRETLKGEKGSEFYESCNNVLDLTASTKKLKESVMSVATSVSIIEQNMNLVLPKTVTVPMANLSLMMAEAWTLSEMSQNFQFSTYMALIPYVWHLGQFLWAGRNLALYFNMSSVINIPNKPTNSKPVRPATANKVPEKNAPMPNMQAPASGPEINIPQPPPIAVLRKIMASHEKAKILFAEKKGVVSAAMTAVMNAKDMLTDATEDMMESVQKEVEKAREFLKEARNAEKAAKDTVAEFAAQITAFNDETARVAVEAAKLIEQEAARRIEEEATKKAIEEARKAAAAARKLAEDAAAAAREAEYKTEKPEVIIKRYKELSSVMGFFRAGRTPEEIPGLLHMIDPTKPDPSKVTDLLKRDKHQRHVDLFKSGGEFFGQLSEEDYKEERSYRFLLERYFIIKKKLVGQNLRIWMDKGQASCRVLLDKANEKAAAAAKAAANAKKAREGNGGLFGRATDTLRSAASSATSIKLPVDSCTELYGAETRYYYYFSMASSLLYLFTNRKFFSVMGFMFTNEAREEIIRAGIQMLQFMGMVAMNGRTIGSAVTLGYSLKSMMTTYTDFSTEMTVKTEEMETGLYPYKFQVSNINRQIEYNAPDGGDLFRRNKIRQQELIANKSRLQEEISKGIDEIRAKVEDARKLYEAQKSDYVVQLREIEAARENARLVMEKTALDMRERELQLREEEAKKRDLELGLQQQALDLQSKQEERNARQEAATREMEQVRVDLERQKIEIAQRGLVQSEEHSRRELEQAEEHARQAASAIKERARNDEAQLSMQAEALRLQAQANQESVANSRNQINSLTSTISQLGATSNAALETLTRQQESLIHLQNTQGRRLNEEARLIGDMDRQINVLRENEEALATGREADAGIRINDVANMERRRRELNALPEAPTGDPRQLANSGTSGPSRRLVAANSNVTRQAGLQARQRIEAEAQARREAEARERNQKIARIESQIGQAQGLGQGQAQRVAVGATGMAMSPAGPVPAGPLGPVIMPVAQAVPAGQGPVNVQPIAIQQKLSLGPAPEPLNFSFMTSNAPVIPMAIMPPRQMNVPGQSSARAISAAAKNLPDSPTNQNAQLNALEKRVKKFGHVNLENIRDMDDIQLRNAFLRLNGLPPWDFMTETYVDFIIRTDLLMGKQSLDEKGKAMANYRAKTNPRFSLKNNEEALISEFENHAPGFKPVELQKMTLERFAREINLSIDEARPHYIAYKQRMFEKSQAENLERRKESNFTIPSNEFKPLTKMDEMRLGRTLRFGSRNTTKKNSPSNKDKQIAKQIAELRMSQSKGKGSKNSKRANGGPKN